MQLNAKWGAALTSLSAVLPSIFTNGMTQPILSVSVSTIAGAAFGTYAAIGYDDTVHPRAKLFFLATSTIIIASALIGVLPSLVHWKWINGGAEGGTAALVSVIIYYGLPEAIPTARRLIRNFKFSDLIPFRKSQTSDAEEKPSSPGEDK